MNGNAVIQSDHTQGFVGVVILYRESVNRIIGEDVVLLGA